MTEYLDEVHSYAVASSIPYDISGQLVDMYYPTGSGVSSTDTRPVFIYAHGGSFNSGSKTNAECVEICSRMAKRGYIALSLNYRLCSGTAVYADVINAVEDMASLRSFVQYAADHPNDNNLTFNTFLEPPVKLCTIDGSKVVMGGDSAGGLLVFMSHAQGSNVQDSSRFLFSSTSIATVQGVLTLWTPFEALAGQEFTNSPYDTYIDSAAMFLAHGTLDADVSINNSEDLVHCSEGNPSITYIVLDNGVHCAWNDATGVEGFYHTADSAWYSWCKDLLGL